MQCSYVATCKYICNRKDCFIAQYFKFESYFFRCICFSDKQIDVCIAIRFCVPIAGKGIVNTQIKLLASKKSLNCNKQTNKMYYTMLAAAVAETKWKQFICT